MNEPLRWLDDWVSATDSSPENKLPGTVENIYYAGLQVTAGGPSISPETDFRRSTQRLANRYGNMSKTSSYSPFEDVIQASQL